MTHSYFIVMVDYGNKGREAIVDPEVTRREVIARLVSGEYKHVNFIHHVDGGLVEDVTEELFDEAERNAERFERTGLYVEEAQTLDHARDLRKHEAV